jgi:hypothetical protein
MNKKIQIYCGIDKYLEAHHEDFHDIMEALCIGGIVKPSKFRRRITFIIPSTKTIKSIEDAITSDKESKVREGIDKIKAGVLDGCFMDKQQWTDAGEVRNALGRSLTVEKVIAPNKVVLNKCTIEKIDVKFTSSKDKDGKDADAFVVYKVIDGELPIDTAEFIRGVPKKNSPVVVGSSEIDRMQYVEDFAKCDASGQILKLYKILEHACGSAGCCEMLPLIYCLRNPLITYSILVLLKSPTSGEYLLSDECVQKCAENNNKFPDVQKIHKTFNDIIANTSARCFQKLEDHFKYLDEIRMDMSGEENAATKIIDIYTQNMKGGFWPKAVVDFIGVENGKLMLYINYLIFLGNFAKLSSTSFQSLKTKLQKLCDNEWNSEDAFNGTILKESIGDFYKYEQSKFFVGFLSTDAILYGGVRSSEDVMKAIETNGGIPLVIGKIGGDLDDAIYISGSYD